MLSSIIVMSGRKLKGKGKGSRRLIDKGAHVNGGAKGVSRSQFSSDKECLTAVLAMTGLLHRVPYSGLASIIIDGMKITGYFTPTEVRTGSGRYKRSVEVTTTTKALG